ncbi:hypothetical protein DPEC_G00284280 [Dallia pectoralis]|uniref:Uncharacterized protein n=1 Tax=Dallia pectoralis TaxID=75939 RepID=A0ACC2FJG6_DALPE|nr:hypothetical protein DPEC_G00284280 [Dallia pectoralis]
MAAMVAIPTAVPSGSLNDLSSDDEPLIALLKKSQTNNEPDETRDTKELNLKSKTITKEDSGLDDTSDDEPLTKLLSKLKKNTAKRPENTNPRRGTGMGREKTKNTIAVSTQDEDSYNSSDDEPLIKMMKRLPKQTSLPFKKRPFNTGRELNDLSKVRKTKTNNICTDSPSSDSSNDLPLSKMVDKMKKQAGKKKLTTTRGTPDIIKTSKVPIKRNRRIGCSDDSSDNEPLNNLSRTSRLEANVRTTRKQCVTKGSNGNCLRKNKRTREEETTSDDEPLIRFFKKPVNAVKKTMASAKKRSVSGKTVVSRKMTKPAIRHKAVNRRCNKVVQSTSEGDSSDNELLNMMRVEHPPMKNLMVILERCDTRQVLEDNCGATVENACESREEVDENSSGELLINVVAKPPSSPKTLEDTKTQSQDCWDEEPLMKMVGNVKS